MVRGRVRVLYVRKESDTNRKTQGKKKRDQQGSLIDCYVRRKWEPEVPLLRLTPQSGSL